MNSTQSTYNFEKTREFCEFLQWFFEIPLIPLSEKEKFWNYLDKNGFDERARDFVTKILYTLDKQKQKRDDFYKNMAAQFGVLRTVGTKKLAKKLTNDASTYMKVVANNFHENYLFDQRIETERKEKKQGKKQEVLLKSLKEQL